MMTTRTGSKSVFITGAGAGIGRAAALSFAADGHKVLVTDVDPRGGQETVSLITEQGGTALFHPCDVTDAASVEAAVAAAIAAFGGLDTAFNNAGLGSEGDLLHACSDAAFDRIMSVNVRGVYLCMKHQIRHMLEHGGGTIVNTGSVAALRGVANGAPYSAAKHAIAGLTQSAAAAYADKGIRVNAVCPGFVDTDFGKGRYDVAAISRQVHPIGRAARVDEVVDAVRWLTSDQSSFVTGALVPVDGGWTSR